MYMAALAGRRNKRRRAVAREIEFASCDARRTCVICLGNINCRGRLPVCDHSYCYTCILEWSKKTNKCPVCKTTFRCITKMSSLSGSPQRQVRVPDIDMNEDDEDEYTYEHVVSFETYSDNQYDLNDSFIDDRQFSTSNSSSDYADSSDDSQFVSSNNTFSTNDDLFSRKKKCFKQWISTRQKRTLHASDREFDDPTTTPAANDT